jgi:hypothetical protein
MHINSKQIIKKRNIFLGIFVLITSLFIVAIALVFIRVKDYNTMTLVNIILVSGLIATSLVFRGTLYGYNNMVRIARIILNQAKPVSYTQNPVKDIKIVSNKGFKRFIETDKFSIYYTHTQDDIIKIKKIWRLTIIILINDQKLDFYDKAIHDEIAKLEVSFTKKELPSKYVILGFKEFDQIDEKAIKDVGEIVSYTNQRHTYTQVNVGLSLKELKAYFLYSDTYYPTRYYQIAIDLIFQLIGAHRKKIEQKNTKK